MYVREAMRLFEIIDGVEKHVCNSKNRKPLNFKSLLFPPERSQLMTQVLLVASTGKMRENPRDQEREPHGCITHLNKIYFGLQSAELTEVRLSSLTILVTL